MGPNWGKIKGQEWAKYAKKRANVGCPSETYRLADSSANRLFTEPNLECLNKIRLGNISER